MGFRKPFRGDTLVPMLALCHRGMVVARSHWLSAVTHRRIGEDADFAQLCSVNARNHFLFLRVRGAESLMVFSASKDGACFPYICHYYWTMSCRAYGRLFI